MRVQRERSRAEQTGDQGHNKQIEDERRSTKEIPRSGRRGQNSNAEGAQDCQCAGDRSQKAHDQSYTAQNREPAGSKDCDAYILNRRQIDDSLNNQSQANCRAQQQQT